MLNRIPMLARLAMGAGGAGLLAVGALGATPALAATTPTPQASASPKAGAHHNDNRQDRRQVGRVVFEAEADVLGIKPEELRKDLREGKTVAQLAGAKGMNEQQFGEAVAKAAKPGLDKLIDSKAITADQAQRVEQRLSAGHVPFWNGRHHRTS